MLPLSLNCSAIAFKVTSGDCVIQLYPTTLATTPPVYTYPAGFSAEYAWEHCNETFHTLRGLVQRLLPLRRLAEAHCVSADGPFEKLINENQLFRTHGMHTFQFASVLRNDMRQFMIAMHHVAFESSISRSINS